MIWNISDIYRDVYVYVDYIVNRLFGLEHILTGLMLVKYMRDYVYRYETYCMLDLGVFPSGRYLRGTLFMMVFIWPG